MKITKISAIPASPGTTAHPMFNSPPWNYVFVKVETDEGIIGCPSALGHMPAKQCSKVAPP